jgi:hypothetical protein
MWMWSTWYLLLGQLPLSWRTRKTNWSAVEFGPDALAAAGLSASPRAAGRSNAFCKFNLLHEKTEGQLSIDEATCWVAAASAVCLPPSAEPCSPPAVTSPAVTMAAHANTQHSARAGIFCGCNKATKVVNTCNKPCPSNGQLKKSYKLA